MVPEGGGGKRQSDVAVLVVGYVEGSNTVNRTTSERVGFMPIVDPATVTQALREAGLEETARNVVFPWGFAIVEVGGVKMLRPYSPEEFRQLAEAEFKRKISDKDLFFLCEYIGGGGCASTGCRQQGGRCLTVSSPHGPGWYCICEH